MMEVCVLVFFYHLIATATCSQNTNILISKWNRYFKDFIDSDDWDSKSFLFLRDVSEGPSYFVIRNTKALMRLNVLIF